MNPTALRWITDFGDSGVTMPLVLLLIALLWFAESRRAAWLLTRALLVCVAVLMTLKIVFLSCGHVFGLGVESPSGHACLTTFVYGCIAVVVWAQPRPALRIVSVAIAALIISFVAASRIVLGAHTVPEVLLGGAAGFATLALFARPYLAITHPTIRLRQIGILLGTAFIITYGTVLPAERYVRGLVPWLQIGLCKA
ncbi:phosphatase PAP2 family protein [Viridibacterium curvum]|uniref:Phosphatidic acid phosphatase type 2/haloperoxidase domain-containing protein n=1 Tax=Viridibacterium curvum TaxID=1101404 RepID=A0ABP9QQ67_9RHOO